jgi:cytochrome P450
VSETEAVGRLSFPMQRTCPFHAPPDYSRLAAEEPVTQVTLPTGKTAWLITGHELGRKFLTDQRTTVDRAHPNFPAMRQASLSKQHAVGLLTWMDPPEHTVHRRMVVNEFTLRRVQAMRPRLQEITDTCVDAMLAGERPVDLVQALSLPVPAQAICELLGVPYEDRRLFDTCTAVMVSRASTVEEKLGAVRELRAFLGKLVTDKDGDPGDDLLSRLVVKYREAGIFDHDLLSGMAMFLLIAGHETTANMITLGIAALLENPEQLTALQTDSSLIPKAVDELLRYFSVADVSTSRVTTADIEIGDVVIPAGEGVIVANSAADWDEQVFEHPEDLNIQRDARRHLAFGHGIHQCLGQNLARVELEIVYQTLFSRIPEIRLAAPVSELSFKTDASVYGIYELPVTW